MDKAAAIKEALSKELAASEGALEESILKHATDVLDAKLSDSAKDLLVENYTNLVDIFGEQHSKLAILKLAKDITAYEMMEKNPEFQKQAELSYNLGELTAQLLVEKLAEADA